MFQTLINAWKLPDLRKRLLFTALMLAIFQLGASIPVPGIPRDALAALLGLAGSVGADGAASSGTVFDLLNIMSGGALEQASIFAMSITPYVTSSIIIQLLTVAIPALERLQKEGEDGRKKLATWTRYTTVILAFIQAAALYVGLSQSGAVAEPGVLGFIIISFSFTAGTAFLMWMGEQITEKGIGNGISMIIFAGIVSRMPQMLQQVWAAIVAGQLNWIMAIAILVLAVLVIAFVVVLNDAERRIPVQYAKRVVGRKMYGGQSSHIPFKVLMAGVMPIIFASSLMSFPSTLANLFGEPSGFWKSVVDFISPTSWFYSVFYFILIVFFTYFYTAMTYNPIEMGNNIKSNGGFVPGIRPGKPTSDFLSKVLNRVTFIGAICIALIAVLPMFMSSQNMVVAFGGTSILIMVGVAIETYRQIESQLLMRHYKGFLE